MDTIQTLFLGAMGAAVKNEQVDWRETMTDEQWEALFHMAMIHRVLPMVYEAVCSCPAAVAANPRLMGFYRLQAIQMVALQTQKTAQFMPMLEKLREAGAEPMVVKGVVCRSLYPNPDHRISSDEDVLVPPEKFSLCGKVLESMGMEAGAGEADAYEVPYTMPGTAQLIEVHRSLFPPQSDAYGDLNRFFDGLQPCMAKGIPTLPPTEHMLYLILHAYKHFIHSGFGIRQVCDMVFFANTYGCELDWERLLACCREVRAEHFAAGLLRIGRKYLGLSLESSRLSLSWQAVYVDEQPLLEDILCAGVYGDADMSRKHSSSITLRAVADRDKDTASPGLLKTVFPSARELEGRYPYLKTKPLLLPVAWTDRLLKYRRETKNTANNTAAGSIRIGSARLALLRQYGILD